MYVYAYRNGVTLAAESYYLDAKLKSGHNNVNLLLNKFRIKSSQDFLKFSLTRTPFSASHIN